MLDGIIVIRQVLCVAFDFFYSSSSDLFENERNYVWCNGVVVSGIVSIPCTMASSHITKHPAVTSLNST